MSVRRSITAVGVALSMAVLAACGSSSGKPSSSASTSPSATLAPVQRQAVPGAPPSESSKMICSAEGQGAIAGSLGVTPRPIKPTWANEVYTCNYVYPNGTMTLSVREYPSDAAAMQAFNAAKTQLGGVPASGGTVLGQGTFQVPSNDSLYVVKDNKLLKVDVSKLPANFGSPALGRSDVALTVGVTIMGCWTGV
jgi:hypothetical protein